MTFLQKGVEEGWPGVVQVALEGGLTMDQLDSSGRSSWDCLFQPRFVEMKGSNPQALHPCAEIVEEIVGESVFLEKLSQLAPVSNDHGSPPPPTKNTYWPEELKVINDDDDQEDFGKYLGKHSTASGGDCREVELTPLSSTLCALVLNDG